MQKQDIIIYENEWDISVDILVENKTFWMTQDQMADLFWKDRTNILKHIQNIYEEWEINKENTIVQKIHNWSIKPTNYYNLEVIIAVWYRVQSRQWTLFRIWARKKLQEYLENWFVLNEEKLKTWKTTEYFDKLQNKLREIRLSEKIFYQKIKDIYTTSIDYDPKDDKTILFFKTVQNKLLWAVSQKTAAELVYNRIDISKPFLWMQSFSKKSQKDITKQDVITAKNYLDEKEIKTLGLIVEQYLAFAESMAESWIVMTMADWIERLDTILKMNGKEILDSLWKISHELAQKKSEVVYLKFKEKSKELERKESLKELENDIKNLTKNTN